MRQAHGVLLRGRLYGSRDFLLFTADKFNMPPYAESLPLVISKYLALGMDLTTIMKVVAETPADLMGMRDKIGTLKAGSDADIAFFVLRFADFAQELNQKRVIL